MGNVVLLCFVIIENCHQPTAEVMEGWVPNYVGYRGEFILFVLNEIVEWQYFTFRYIWFYSYIHFSMPQWGFAVLFGLIVYCKCLLFHTQCWIFKNASRAKEKALKTVY